MKMSQLFQPFRLSQPWRCLSYFSYLGYRSLGDVPAISAIRAIATMEMSQLFQLFGLSQTWGCPSYFSYLGYRSHWDIPAIPANWAIAAMGRPCHSDYLGYRSQGDVLSVPAIWAIASGDDACASKPYIRCEAPPRAMIQASPSAEGLQLDVEGHYSGQSFRRGAAISARDAGDSYRLFVTHPAYLPFTTAPAPSSPSALVLSVPTACCGRYRQESSSRSSPSLDDVLGCFGSFSSAGGPFLDYLHVQKGLSCPSVGYAQSSTTYLLVHALFFCMASLFASTNHC